MKRTHWLGRVAVALSILLLGIAAFAVTADDATAQGLPVQFSGTIEAVNSTTMILNGQVVDITNIQLSTPLSVGMNVAVTGTRTADGRIVAATLSVLTGVVTATPTSPAPGFTPTPAPIYECALGLAYWRGEATWPLPSLMLGTQNYTRDEVMALLNTQSGGDASIILAQQLAVAKLNIANGTDSQPAGSVIIQADTMLSRFDGKIPYNLHPSSSVGQGMLTHAQVLDSYNSNLLTPSCRRTTVPNPPSVTTPNPDDDRDIVVIEGPVSEVNGNIITLYNIDVILDPNDPALTTLQVGSVIRVQGFLSEDDGDDDTLVLIAVNVTVVNLNIYDRNGNGTVDDGDFDDNDCNNPPPPWAPAHGWRARCEGGPRPGNANGNSNGNGNGNSSGRGDGGSGNRGNGSGRGDGGSGDQGS